MLKIVQGTDPVCSSRKSARLTCMSGRDDDVAEQQLVLCYNCITPRFTLATTNFKDMAPKSNGPICSFHSFLLKFNPFMGNIHRETNDQKLKNDV